jgi:hypothetical protein
MQAAKLGEKKVATKNAKKLFSCFFKKNKPLKIQKRH